MNNRVELLKSMHCIMTYMNNEDCYQEWIYEMPDCPTETDYMDIAKDDVNMKEVRDEFERLIKHYIKDGIWIPRN